MSPQHNLNNALMPSLALPQQVEIVPVSSTQVQRTVYDPNDIIAMRKAMQERNKRSSWEALSNALGSVQPKSYTGAYGVEVSNPWVEGIASALQGFDKAYTARKDAERKLADDEFELAKMMAEANKRAITTQVQEQAIKRNVKDDSDEQIKTSQLLDIMENDLEDIGTRFDDDYSNIDEMQKGVTRLEVLGTDALWGAGRSTGEKLAREQFEAWKGSMKNVLVNANRKAGTGSMSDADAARFEQNLGEAKNPAEARNILDSFKARMSMTPLNKRENILNNGFENQMSQIQQNQDEEDILMQQIKSMMGV